MSVLPKPPTWRVVANTRNEQALYFYTPPPSPRRRRALKRWFGWRVQVPRISGEWIDA